MRRNLQQYYSRVAHLTRMCTVTIVHSSAQMPRPPRLHKVINPTAQTLQRNYYFDFF